MKKTKIFFATLCIFLMSFNSSYNLLVFASDSKTSNQINAYIDNIKGTIFIGKKLYRARNNKSNAITLNTGDIIWTLQNSSGNVMFEDGSIFRLSANTKFEIQDLDKNETDLNIQNGSVWARILKPIGSGTTYNVQTKSVSASVRGTSVMFRHEEQSGLISIKVIDSVTDKGSLVLKPSASKSKRGVKIDKETSIVLDFKNKVGKANKIDIEEELTKDKEIKENTKKDLIYMTNLIKQSGSSNSSGNSSSDSSSTEDEKPKLKIDLEKVSGEISQSMPETEKEAEALFDNKEVAAAYTSQKTEIEDFSTKLKENQNNEEAVEKLNKLNNYIVKDEVITQIKEANIKNQENEEENSDSSNEENQEENNKKIEAVVKVVMENDFSEDDVEEIAKDGAIDVEKTFEKIKEKTDALGEDSIKNALEEMTTKVKIKQEKEDKDEEEKTQEQSQKELEQTIKNDLENMQERYKKEDNRQEQDNNNKKNNEIGNLDVVNDGNDSTNPEIDGVEVNGSKSEVKSASKDELESSSTENTYVYKGEEFLYDEVSRKYWYLSRKRKEEKIEEERETFKSKIDARIATSEEEKVKTESTAMAKVAAATEEEEEEEETNDSSNNNNTDDTDTQNNTNNNIIYNWQQAAEEQRQQVENQRKKAEEERKKAEEERKRIEEENKQKAEEEKKRIEEENKNRYNQQWNSWQQAMEEQRKQIEEQRKKAEEERKKAEEERKRIEEERKKQAEEQRQRWEDFFNPYRR